MDDFGKGKVTEGEAGSSRRVQFSGKHEVRGRERVHSRSRGSGGLPNHRAAVVGRVQVRLPEGFGQAESFILEEVGVAEAVHGVEGPGRSLIGVYLAGRRSSCLQDALRVRLDLGGYLQGKTFKALLLLFLPDPSECGFLGLLLPARAP